MSTDFSKGIVKYTSRDYTSILADFLAAVPALTDLWKPEAESDPGYVIGKYLASIADMLGVNLDWLANEIYAPSVLQRKDAEKVFGLFGYKLGWYVAAKTEVTISNASDSDNVITLDFGFNGNNFATVSAQTDITGQERVITYNLIPGSHWEGARPELLPEISPETVFSENGDKVNIPRGGSVTFQAIEGELRSFRIDVKDIKANNYIIKLPSQHIDLDAVWVQGYDSDGKDNTVWAQVASPSDFIVPEPRFSVTYDNYSNAQVQISSYLDSMENYSERSLVVYWIDCSGVIGCVGTNVLSGLMLANPGTNTEAELASLSITNLSNTLELPNTAVQTGSSPETAKEAYYNSRNYVNTWNSLITLPDFTKFLRRQKGVDCGIAIDCQKAVDINLAIYNDQNLTDEQKKKKYITYLDFAEGEDTINLSAALNLDFDPSDPKDFKFGTNFKRYTVMCFAIHNQFESSEWGQGKVGYAQMPRARGFYYYQPPTMFIQAIKDVYKSHQAMTTEIEFGKLRIFDFHIVGTVYPTHKMTTSSAENLVKLIKEKLKLYFSSESWDIGKKPTLIEITDVIRGASDDINYFDAGSGSIDVIHWDQCDIDYFNAISFSRYNPDSENAFEGDIIVAPEYIIN